MSLWTERSSAEVGSSRTTSFGCRIMARAIARRWRCPPENSCGKRLRQAMRSGSTFSFKMFRQDGQEKRQPYSYPEPDSNR